MAKGLTDQERDFALGRVIAIVNDKGGVGKTSIAANLAGQFAGAGYRCLLIDLNRQANLADDLGYRGSEADDQGAGLLDSVLSGNPLTPALGHAPAAGRRVRWRAAGGPDAGDGLAAATSRAEGVPRAR